jgi:acetylornithine deacetylase/succinyl-diaminopimelate desuccinylase-like protein
MTRPWKPPRIQRLHRLCSTPSSRSFGAARPCVGAHYGTDGSKLAAAGIETVVCGPGNIAQAHTKAEFVERSK